MTSVAIARKAEILELVQQGAMLKSVATMLGVTPAAISNQLHADPDYRKAREIGAEVRLEEQFEEIQNATGKDSVSRAREGFKAAAWFAEREFPGRWGQRTTVDVNVNIGETLQTIAERRMQRIAAQQTGQLIEHAQVVRDEDV